MGNKEEDLWRNPALTKSGVLVGTGIQGRKTPSSAPEQHGWEVGQTENCQLLRSGV